MLNRIQDPLTEDHLRSSQDRSFNKARIVAGRATVFWASGRGTISSANASQQKLSVLHIAIPRDYWSWTKLVKNPQIFILAPAIFISDIQLCQVLYGVLW